MFVQVVEQGLTPGMALGACKLPGSDSSKLSRKITEAVETVARAELALESTMKSAVSSKNTNHDEEPRKKRSRSSSSSAASAAAASANSISPVPLPLPSSAPAQKPPPDLVSSTPHIRYLIFIINLWHRIFKKEGKKAATSAKRLIKERKS